MWPIQLAFLFILLSVRYSSPPLTQCDTSSFLTWSVQLIFSPSFASTTFRNWSTARTVPSFSTIYSYVPNFNISLACLNWNAISSWKKKSLHVTECCFCHGIMSYLNVLAIQRQYYSTLTIQGPAACLCIIRYNIHNSTFCPHSCIFVFCIYLRTNSHYFPTQH